jgi:hypothetical protein
MPAAPRIHYGTAFEDMGAHLMDRVYGNAGTAITQASIGSISYRVYEHDSKIKAETAGDGALVAGTASSLVVSSVVFDTLQTDAPWDTTADAQGYNFRYDSPAADRPTGGKWYRHEIVFTPASGAAFAVVWVIECLAMAGS